MHNKLIYLSLFCLPLCLTPRLLKAQDLTLLSIEELGEIDVFSGTVLDTHIHQKDDMMFAIHHSYSTMNNIKQNTNNISINDVFSQYRVSPTEMNMSMTMFHVMYAYSDNLTLAFMTHFMDMSMKHKTIMGRNFTTHSQGIGDSTLTFNYLLNENTTSKSRWVMHSSLIIPTGSINEKDTTPMGYTQLPYAMQLGSGSYQIKLGVDYTITKGSYILSSKIFAQSPINDNNANYRVGENVLVEISYLYSLTNKVSVNTHLDYMWKNNISGFDERLNSSVVPTASALNYGGESVDLNIGISWLFSHKNKFSIYYKKPLWQDRKGIQLQNDWQLKVGWEITL